jgi:DNA-binding MarR family transcriptional regulator
MTLMATDRDELAREALRKFRVIFGAVRQHFQAVEQACGVSGSQVWVMATLAESPGMRVSQLANALSIHQSTASNLLDKIEKAGLIRRQRGSKDQRVVQLFLTEAGEAALARAPKPFTGLLTYALGKLSMESLKGLNKDLNLVIDGMERVDAAAADRPISEL